VKENVVVNDRWGKDAMCKHGGFFTCQDRFNPGMCKHGGFLACQDRFNPGIYV
jgi:alpha-L-fucosidase